MSGEIVEQPELTRELIVGYVLAPEITDSLQELASIWIEIKLPTETSSYLRNFLLGRLTLRSAQVEQLEDIKSEMESLVTQAYGLVGWDEIGMAAGITSEAAKERWGDLVVQKSAGNHPKKG